MLTVKKNTEAVIVTSKEAGLGLYAEETKYIFMSIMQYKITES